MRVFIKNFIKKIFGAYDYDRKAEKYILDSIKIYHRPGKINQLRAVRRYNIIRSKYNCNIWPGIELGENTYIAHAHDVCIGRTAIIGNNCKIYPHADITAAVKGDEERGRNNLRRHAKIGNDCILGNGCIIVGPVTVGDDVTIGARAVVTKDVPAHTVVKNVNQFREKRPEEIPDKYKVTVL